jgi:deoxycytidylate deaminase
MNKIINNLVSSINIEKGCKYQHFSGIYKNSKPLYHGCNNLRNSYNGQCICYSTHAEIDVIFKVIKNKTKQPLDLSDHVIVVARFGKDGTLKNSRPCNDCLDTMSKYRIKKIMYSTDEGTFKVDKPEQMEKTHISSGWRAFKRKMC